MAFKDAFFLKEEDPSEMHDLAKKYLRGLIKEEDLSKEEREYLISFFKTETKKLTRNNSIKRRRLEYLKRTIRKMMNEMKKGGGSYDE